MREMFKMVLTLSLICAFAGLMLASVKTFTKNRIDEQVLTYVQGPALETVLPPHSNNPIKERFTLELSNNQKLVIFPASEQEQLKAVAFEMHAEGYGGKLGVMIGVDLQSETLTGIGITTHKETPGVGSKVTQSDFTKQFTQHPFSSLALRSNGGDIDGISGATVSSQAALVAVAQGVEMFKKNKEAIVQGFARQ